MISTWSEKEKTDRVVHVLLRKYLLKYTVEGKIQMTGRRGRRHKQLPDGLKETKGYWNLKVEALDCTVWRTGFGKRLCGCPMTDYGMMIVLIRLQNTIIIINKITKRLK